jgi:uncharacterized membrane protein YraQ (UPF0718 family)
MTFNSKLETSLLTFGRLRRWLVAGIGLVVAVEGVVKNDWLSLVLGVAIMAYGMFAPT